MKCPQCGYMMDAFDPNCPRCKNLAGVSQVPTMVRPPVVPAPSLSITRASNDKNICSDCGKRMGAMEKFVNSLEGDNRCADCDRKFKQAQEQQLRDQENRQIAIARQIEADRIAQRNTALQDIQNGNLPTVPSTIVLKKNEVCHHVTQAGILENRVVDRVRVGQSASVSFRVCKGVRYRVGGSRGRMVAITGVVQVDTGQLWITNQRCVWDGQVKSYSIPHKKLISFEPASDGLQLNPENKKAIIYQVEDGELVAVILSTILNQADI